MNAAESVLVNSRSPIPLWRCKHCGLVLITTARAHHLVRKHIARAIVVQWKQSHVDDEYTRVMS